MSSIEIDDEGKRRWDGREAEEYGVLIFNSVFMVVTVGFLAAMGITTLRAPTTSFRIGVLAGSTAMYANMALLSFFYFISFEKQEDEQGRRGLEGNNNDYDNNNNENDEIEEGRMQKIMSIMSLVFAFGYGIVSIIIIMSTKSMATSQADNESFDSVNVVQSSAHTDVLADVWKFLSIFSVVATAISFVAGFVSLFTEEGDRMREEGELFNLLLISAWTILLVGGLYVLGKRSFVRHSSTSQIEVGFFAGALYFFGAASLLLAGLYGGFSIDGGRGGMEDSVGYLIFAFSCFTFAMVYLAFVSLVSRYHMSILHVNNDEVASDYVPMNEKLPSLDLTNYFSFRY